MIVIYWQAIVLILMLLITFPMAMGAGRDTMHYRDYNKLCLVISVLDGIGCLSLFIWFLSLAFNYIIII
jgi:hypothetical protein